MAPSVSRFMQAVADAFCDGDHVWLASIYAYPLAIFVDGKIRIERTSQDTLDSLFSRRATALSLGMKRIRATVLESGDVSSGRFPVRVDWDILNASDELITRNEVRYFCRLTPDGTIRIEILEFLKLGIPFTEDAVSPSSKH